MRSWPNRATHARWRRTRDRSDPRSPIPHRTHSMPAKERIALQAPVGWKTVAGAIAIAAVAISAAQVLLRKLFMDLEIIDGRIVSGIFHAIVVIVPVILFLAWRATAEEEVRVRR